MNRYKMVVALVASSLICGRALASRLNQEDGILPNHSAEYVRLLNRNASTSPDAAFYNPAGLAFLEAPGLWVMFSSQTYYAKRVHEMDYYGLDVDGGGNRATSHTADSFHGRLPNRYFAETLAPVLPDLDVVYKDDGWGVFFDLSVMQAAPKMTFPEGLAVMDWGNLAALETGYYATDDKVLVFTRDAKAVRTEYYIGGTVGGAYRVLDWLSAGLGLRYIHAQGNQYIRIKNAAAVTEASDLADPERLALEDWQIDTDTQGHGFGLILSVHARPWRRFDVALRYEYYAPLTMEKETKTFLAPEAVESSGDLNIFKDGTPGDDMEYLAGNGERTLKVTYPQTVSLGIAYGLLPGLRAEASGEVSLRGQRDLGGREQDWGVGYRLGAGLAWELWPGLEASAGYVYNDFGIKPSRRTEVDPLLTSHTIGAGLGVEVDERLTLSLGGCYSVFVPEKVYTTEFTDVTAPTVHYVAKEFDEKRLSVGIGITYRFLGDPARAEE
jgi:long-chain fatty acid transport protein